MKLILIATLVCLARAFPQGFESENRPLVGLLRSETDGPTADGTYSFRFESEDGIQREEEGQLNSVSGSYSYTAPDGTFVEVRYVADEEGYKPEVIIGWVPGFPFQPDPRVGTDFGDGGFSGSAGIPSGFEVGK